MYLADATVGTGVAVPTWVGIAVGSVSVVPPAAVVGAAAAWVVHRGYVHADVEPPFSTYLLGVAFLLVALYLGPVVAFNLYGT